MSNGIQAATCSTGTCPVSSPAANTRTDNEKDVTVFGSNNQSPNKVPNNGNTQYMLLFPYFGQQAQAGVQCPPCGSAIGTGSLYNPTGGLPSIGAFDQRLGCEPQLPPPVQWAGQPSAPVTLPTVPTFGAAASAQWNAMGCCPQQICLTPQQKVAIDRYQQENNEPLQISASEGHVLICTNGKGKFIRLMPDGSMQEADNGSAAGAPDKPKPVTSVPKGKPVDSDDSDAEEDPCSKITQEQMDAIGRYQSENGIIGFKKDTDGTLIASHKIESSGVESRATILKDGTIIERTKDNDDGSIETWRRGTKGGAVTVATGIAELPMYGPLGFFDGLRRIYNGLTEDTSMYSAKITYKDRSQEYLKYSNQEQLEAEINRRTKPGAQFTI